jgi:NAD+ kinase
MMRVLVVYKQSFLEAHGRDASVWRRLAPAERARFRHADRENRAALKDILGVLARAGAQATPVYRGHLAASPRFDLIVTVGGDGTFFMAAHRAHGTPIMAINSHPGGSLGLFAAADRATFPAKLKAALAGRLPATRLNRMSVLVNGRARPELALNDVLVAHRSPASLSRLALSVDGGPPEIQRNSGLWVATAAGSTAAIRAAGGRRMPIASRRLQFLSREPYEWPVRPRLLRGFARTIDARILMNESSLWIDGVRTRVDLRLGDRVRLATGAEPAVVLGFDARRRDRLFP